VGVRSTWITEIEPASIEIDGPGARNAARAGPDPGDPWWAWQVDGPAVEHRTVFLPEQPIREMQPPAGSVSSETSCIVMSCLALYSFALPNDLTD
jgi:hypothetical protein